MSKEPTSPSPSRGFATEARDGFRRGFGWQSRVGRYTFPRHCSYSAADGVFQGAVTSGFLAFVCIQYFNLSKDEEDLYAFLLTWFPSLLMLSAPLWDRPFGRSSRYWMFNGVASRFLVGIALALVNAPWQVVLIVAAATILSSGVSPLQNALFARNYGPQERERAHGLAKMLHIVAYITANFGLAAWMDADAEAFRYAIPVAGLLALIGMAAIGSVKMRRIPQADVLESARWHRAPRPWEDAVVPISDQAQPGTPAVKPSPFRTLMWISISPARAGFEGVSAPYRRTVRLLRRNPNFALFELGFMLYGCGFMMLQPIIPTFSQRVLGLETREFSIMTTVAFMGTMFVLHPLTRGRTGSMSAAKGAGIAFALVLGFPVLLLIVNATASYPIAILAFCWWGLAMLFVDYAWNFGPVKFAKGRDPMPFVSAHAMLVGLRALIAFPAAYQIKIATPSGDFFWNIVIPCGLLVLAVLSTIWLSVRMKRDPPLPQY